MVKGIDLTARDWLQLLELRTGEEAQEVVLLVREMAIQNPEEAMQFIWQEFERQYATLPQASQNLMRHLQQFYEVSTSDPDNLARFARACRQAVVLSSTDQGRELQDLDRDSTQLTVTRKLNPALRERWKQHYTRCRPRDRSMNVPFREFSEWISDIVEEKQEPGLQFGERESVKARLDPGRTSPGGGARVSPVGPPPGGPHVRSMMTRLEDGRELCRYFKFGFCKFQNTPDGCSKRHNDQVCPRRESCPDIDSCKMRHPKTCRFFRDNGWWSGEDCE